MTSREIINKVQRNEEACTAVYTISVPFTNAEKVQLCEALKTNTHVDSLWLYDDFLKTTDFTALSDMLTINQNITDLGLWICNLVTPHGALLAEGLKHHPTLETLFIDGASDATSDLQPIITALRDGCSALEVLKLTQCVFSPLAAAELASLVHRRPTLRELNCLLSSLCGSLLQPLLAELRTNTTLQTLELYDNDLTDADAFLLADMLRVNTALQTLDLSRNASIRSAGWEAICDAMDSNRSITELDIKETNIPASALERIAAAVLRNKSSAAAEHEAAAAAVAKQAKKKAKNDAKRNQDEVEGEANAAASASRAAPSPAAGCAAAAATDWDSSTSPDPIMSAESLSAHVRSLADVRNQLAALTQLPAAVTAQSRTLAPLLGEHARRQSELAALRCIQSSESAAEYHAHVRLLLTCAHVGATAIRSGNIVSSGSLAATVGQKFVEQLPTLIGKALGKAAESIPFIGAGASALSAVIAAVDARSLNVQLQCVVKLAHTPGELTALVDTLARRLTLLQWETLSNADTLRGKLADSGMLARAKTVFGATKAHAMFAFKGERHLTDAEKYALQDMERFIQAVAENEFSTACPRNIVGDQPRADWITHRAVILLLPKLDNYEETLPSLVSAAPTVNQSSVPLHSVAAVTIVAAAAAANVSSSGSDTAALLALTGKLARLEAGQAARAEKEAAREAELTELRAEAAAQKAATAAHKKTLSEQAVLLKKLQGGLDDPDVVYAGSGQVYVMSSSKSPAAQSEADRRTIAQLQRRVDELNTLVMHLHARAEETDAFADFSPDTRAKTLAAAEEKQARVQLAEAKAKLMERSVLLAARAKPQV